MTCCEGAKVVKLWNKGHTKGTGFTVLFRSFFQKCTIKIFLGIFIAKGLPLISCYKWAVYCISVSNYALFIVGMLWQNNCEWMWIVIMASLLTVEVEYWSWRCTSCCKYQTKFHLVNAVRKNEILALTSTMSVSEMTCDTSLVQHILWWVQRLERCVLRRLRKMGSDGADVTCWGRPLQTWTVDTGKACSMILGLGSCVWLTNIRQNMIHTNSGLKLSGSSDSGNLQWVPCIDRTVWFTVACLRTEYSGARLPF